MNLILDLDDTLVSSCYYNSEEYYNTQITLKNKGLDIEHIENKLFIHNPEYFIIERPYLQQFFDYIFQHFDTVSIWTAAKPSHFNYVYNQIIKDYLPLNKSFHFVWTRKHCILANGCYSFIKPLSKVYKHFPSFTKDNTYIVDDNLDTYRLNINNSIQICVYYPTKYDIIRALHKNCNHICNNEDTKIIDKHYLQHLQYLQQLYHSQYSQYLQNRDNELLTIIDHMNKYLFS